MWDGGGGGALREVAHLLVMPREAGRIPVFLEHIIIENLRSIARAEIDFRADSVSSMRKWSLFVGDNGAGKSTALKAIALVLAGSDALPHVIGAPGSWVRRGSAKARILATLRTAEWEERRIELVINAEDQPIDVLKANDEGLRLLDAALRYSPANYLTVGYGPYRRLSPPSISFARTSSAVPTRAQGIVTLFDKDAVLQPLTSWAMNLEYQQGEEGLGIVRDAMNALLPDIQFERIDKQAGALIFSTRDGDLPLDQLSDGYQNVAGWIGDLLTRITDSFSRYKEPLSARGLLLIDEVDAHLHPTWQRKLRHFLDTKLPNFQIIASTHSALTLQQAREGEAIVLSRAGGEDVQVRPFPGDPSKLRLHQIYDLAFGITSLDSWEVEQDKQQYREFIQRPIGDLSLSEAVAFEAVKRKLELLPTDPAPALGNAALDAFFQKLDSATERLAARTKEAEG